MREAGYMVAMFLVGTATGWGLPDARGPDHLVEVTVGSSFYGAFEEGDEFTEVRADDGRWYRMEGLPFGRVDTGDRVRAVVRASELDGYEPFTQEELDELAVRRKMTGDVMGPVTTYNELAILRDEHDSLAEIVGDLSRRPDLGSKTEKLCEDVEALKARVALIQSVARGAIAAAPDEEDAE